MNECSKLQYTFLKKPGGASTSKNILMMEGINQQDYGKSSASQRGYNNITISWKHDNDGMNGQR